MSSKALEIISYQRTKMLANIFIYHQQIAEMRKQHNIVGEQCEHAFMLLSLCYVYNEKIQVYLFLCCVCWDNSKLFEDSVLICQGIKFEFERKCY